MTLLALGDFSGSVDSFEKALKLRPLFQAAAIAKQAAKRKKGLDRVHWARRTEDYVDEPQHG